MKFQTNKPGLPVYVSEDGRWEVRRREDGRQWDVFDDGVFRSGPYTIASSARDAVTCIYAPDPPPPRPEPEPEPVYDSEFERRLECRRSHERKREFWAQRAQRPPVSGWVLYQRRIHPSAALSDEERGYHYDECGHHRALDADGYPIMPPDSTTEFWPPRPRR